MTTFPTLNYSDYYNGVRFWMLPAFKQTIPMIQRAIENPPPPDQRFKDDPKRIIFKLDAAPLPLLIKINRLPRFKDRLRPWRFAAAEFKSHRTVLEAHVKCPKIIGAFQQKNSWLPKLNGLVIEFMKDFRELKTTETQPAAEMLAILFDKGINHPDFTHKNVMINEQNGELAVIDLESSASVRNHSLPSLLMMTQRFIEFNETNPLADENQLFITQVFQQTAPTNVSENAFRKAVMMLLQRHQSRKERQRLILNADVRRLITP